MNLNIIGIPKQLIYPIFFIFFQFYSSFFPLSFFWNIQNGIFLYSTTVAEWRCYHWGGYAQIGALNFNKLQHMEDWYQSWRQSSVYVYVDHLKVIFLGYEKENNNKKFEQNMKKVNGMTTYQTQQGRSQHTTLRVLKFSV